MEKSFEEWLNELPLQTLTDELKQDVLNEHKAHCEKEYSEQEVKLLLYAFQAAFDKPCYTVQLRYNCEMKEILSKDSLFPMESFYEQYFKNYKNENNKSNSV